MNTAITDVRTVAVSVRDQDRAIEFFANTLGFEKRLDVPAGPAIRWVEVAPPGAQTSIALQAADDLEDGPRETGIRFTVQDAEAAHEAMRTNGVAVTELLRWDATPPMYTFDDPDGNRFVVVEEARS